MFEWFINLFQPKSVAAEKVTFGVHDFHEKEELQDLIKGAVFHCTLQITTPLKILKLHGKKYEPPINNLPNYCDPKYGCWLPELKTFKELGAKIDLDIPKSKSASDVGSVYPEDYLPFLVRVREIVESQDAEAEKIKKILGLKSEDINFAHFIRIHKKNNPDFPIQLFYEKFLSIPGIGIKSARSLYKSGICSFDELKESSDKTILKAEGIGKVTLGKIRAYLTA